MIHNLRNQFLAFAACLFLGATLALAAGSPARVKRHQATGEIISVTPATLILLHARGRNHQRMVFHLTPGTKKTVVVAKGKRVTVFYTIANGRMNALRIRAPRTKKR